MQRPIFMLFLMFTVIAARSKSFSRGKIGKTLQRVNLSTGFRSRAQNFDISDNARYQ